MDAATRRLVWDRAKGRCEYYLIPALADDSSFCIDHIVAVKHRGPSAIDNLALSCFHCNSFKLDNIASFDIETGILATLFNPRTQSWREHLSWDGADLLGLTPTGRVTIHILNMNAPGRVNLRKHLLGEGHQFS